MQTVDLETRVLAMKHRLDALDGYRLFDELNYGVQELQAEDND